MSVQVSARFVLTTRPATRRHLSGIGRVSVVSVMVRPVGIRSAARLLEAQAALVAAAQALPSSDVSRPAQRGVLSPWQSGQLSSIVWADVFGTDLTMVSRADAMSVPAVVKGRQVIVGQLAGLPLRAMRGPDVLPDKEQPTFLYATSGPVSPWHRMAWTIDDLIFTGWSLWSVVRGSDRAILSADRVPLDCWEFTPDGAILVYKQPVNADDVILFPGPSEGLLAYATRTIRAYRNTEDAWQKRVRNPVPVVELHQTTEDTLTAVEVGEYLDGFAAARRDPDGALTFTPHNIQLITHNGEGDGDLLIGARNALRVDIANFLGLPAAALDGSVAAASLTYVTTEGKFSELGEVLRGLWAEPIEARLSQDDVVPRGQRVRFDATDRLAVAPSPTGPEVLD